MPNKFEKMTARNFNPMSAPRLSEEARNAVKSKARGLGWSDS
jgi:hypothetical protein